MTGVTVATTIILKVSNFCHSNVWDILERINNACHIDISDLLMSQTIHAGKCACGGAQKGRDLRPLSRIVGGYNPNHR